MSATPRNSNISQTDLAYLAGLIDGEGTISCSINITKTNIRALQKQLSIFNTNYALIEWINEKFGGKIHSRKRSDKWKIENQIKWSAEDAAVLLQQVLPYLVIKREQAEIFIALHNTKSLSEISESVHQYRETLVSRVKELNKRGTN